MGPSPPPHPPDAKEHSHPPDRAWTRDEGRFLLESAASTGLDPDALWRRVPLSPGTVVVDVGAGAGRFAVPAARQVGPSGKVYAVDISEQLVELLREEARKAQLPQLIPVKSTPRRIPLPERIADVVLLANVLHDVSMGTVEEAVRVLRDGGRFVNLDWKKESTPMGPPLSVRLDPGEADERLREVGLAAAERWEAGPYHYAARYALGPSARAGGSARHRPVPR